jgi:predicted permease
MTVAIDGVGPGYFETEGIPILLGRSIAAQDTKGSPVVAVVNEAFAHDFFPGQNPIGRRFGSGGGNPEHSGDIEIIGVVQDAKFFSLRDKPPRMVFLSIFQDVGDLAYAYGLEVRAAGDPKGVASEVRKALEDVDKNLPVTDIKTLPKQIHDGLNQELVLSELSSFFGFLALLLACLGLYGLMNYTVAGRTHEIGIRVALGAKREDVMRLVLGEGVALALIGIGGGWAAALALTRFLSSLLYGVRPTDPLTLAVVSLVLGTVALLACYIPARRATKVDPMVALRYE